jgi:hypothetical protein
MGPTLVVLPTTPDVAQGLPGMLERPSNSKLEMTALPLVS